MGGNTHVANSSGQTVTVVLTDNDNRNTSQVIAKGKSVCIPTPDGRVSVSVFRGAGISSGTGLKRAEAEYTADSDCSFIVKETEGALNLFRSVLGKIWDVVPETN